MAKMCVGGKIVFAERGVESHEIINKTHCRYTYIYSDENLTPQPQWFADGCASS